MLLRERREAEFRRACYTAGIVAATVINAKRQSEKDPVATAFDFVPRDVEDAERERVLNNIRSLFAMMVDAKPEQIAVMKQKVLDGLRSEGHDDAEAILAEAIGHTVMVN